MKQHGIFLRLQPMSSSAGQGAAGATLTSAATIYTRGQGIRVARTVGGTNDATTITNTGNIFSGVGNAADTSAYRDQPNGIFLQHGQTDRTGSAKIVNTGAVTVSGAYIGILIDYWGPAAAEIDNGGTINAAMGTGIQLDYHANNDASAGAITLINRGAVTASVFGVRLKNGRGTGDVTLTNSGAITVSGEAATGAGHALWLLEDPAGT